MLSICHIFMAHSFITCPETPCRKKVGVSV